MGLFKNKPAKWAGRYRTESARWQGYDYSQDGFYFVTICTENKELFFGDIRDGKMVLSKIGKIADKFWLKISDHFSFVKLDCYVIMPNHVHVVLYIDHGQIDDDGGYTTVETRRGASLPRTQNKHKRKFGPLQKNSISSIINHYKGGVTKLCCKYDINFAWQARFHDRVIRNENELNRVRQYIIDNPLRWELDRNNKNNLYI